MKIVSPLVTDGNRVGKIWAVDESPYDGSSPAAYVVGTGWADWIAAEDLRLVEVAAVETAA